MPGKPVPLDRKQAILADAKQKIMEGLTLEQIAHSHGVASRTLEYWLHALGDEYIELRQAWIDGMLHEAGELLKGNSITKPGQENSEEKPEDAPLRLARARELWKRATWYAERRDRARYGDNAPMSVSGEQLADLLMHVSNRMLREKQVNALPNDNGIKSANE